MATGLWEAMDSTPRTTLRRAIVALFATGLLQDAATAHCLASTLGPLAPEVLAARLADADDLEAASLRELLFFPDQATALALEPVLAAADLDAAGQAALERDLAGEIRQARVLLPQRPPLVLAVRPDDLRLFVGRLRPTNSPPVAVRQVLAERYPAPLALELAVACRQAALAWSPPRRSFLATLLGRLAPDGPDTPEAVRFALGLLADLPAQIPPLAALPRRREALAAQYQRALLQEQSLAQSNFETLIVTGNRLPHLHAPTIARDLALADGILLAMTGRPGASDRPTQRDLGTVDDMEGLLEAFGDPGERL
jgi:hypothetical protein